MGRDLGRARVLHGRPAFGQGPLLHRDPAAERDRAPARRARARAHARGHADPPRADAGLRGAVGPGDGSRGDRHPGRGRTQAPRGGHRRAATWVARRSSSASGPGRNSTAARSSSRSSAWAPRSTGHASGSRWTRASRERCASRSCACTRTGLIYRGERLVNWCPDRPHGPERLRGRARRGRRRARDLPLPALGRLGAIEVATTRVETMLGDTGIAVHPGDERYTRARRHDGHAPLRRTRDPDRGRPSRRPEFGTGAVKVTPAHDQNDFDIAQRTGCR